MCWRDEIFTDRYCYSCKQPYYGSLGHIGCPAKNKPLPSTPRAQEKSKKPSEEETGPPF